MTAIRRRRLNWIKAKKVNKDLSYIDGYRYKFWNYMYKRLKQHWQSQEINRTKIWKSHNWQYIYWKHFGGNL